MSDQGQAINEAIGIISNLLRKTDGMETTIECLRGMIRDRDKLVDNLTKEIETMKKKEEKK